MYMMKCGHAADAVKGTTQKPVCSSCSTEDAEIIDREVNGTEGLEGRKAKCLYRYACSNTTESKWELPFFKHLPNEPFDKYYCGCQGWD